MEQEIESRDAMLQFGQRLGSLCKGGEVIELVGDIGAGKTTLTKGIANGLGVDDEVQSPTFTLSRTYRTPSGLVFAHYDFYRLTDPGILRIELEEATRADDTVVVIEWADTVHDALPQDHLKLTITASGDTSRRLLLQSGGPKSAVLVEALR